MATTVKNAGLASYPTTLRGEDQRCASTRTIPSVASELGRGTAFCPCFLFSPRVLLLTELLGPA